MALDAAAGARARDPPDDPEMPAGSPRRCCRPAGPRVARGAARTLELDATFTFSAREVLQRKDFETMTIEELAAGEAADRRRCGCRSPRCATRRSSADARGQRVDLRATLPARPAPRAPRSPAARSPPRVRRTPPLVVLCDISGSMSRYSRMFLHFLHAITNDRDRVHTCCCSARGSPTSRGTSGIATSTSRSRGVAAAVADWSGGTRIGVCIKEFNLRWSRRVLGQNAVVLLISDGLDARRRRRTSAAQMERLHKSLPAADLAEPAAALRGLRAAAGRRARDAAARRRFPAGAQSRQPRRPDPRARAARVARPWRAHRHGRRRQRRSTRSTTGACPVEMTSTRTIAAPASGCGPRSTTRRC